MICDPDVIVFTLSLVFVVVCCFVLSLSPLPPPLLSFVLAAKRCPSSLPVPFILPALSRNNFICQAWALMVALFWGLSLTSSFHLCFRHGLTATTTYLTLQTLGWCDCSLRSLVSVMFLFTAFPSLPSLCSRQGGGGVIQAVVSARLFVRPSSSSASWCLRALVRLAEWSSG